MKKTELNNGQGSICQIYVPSGMEDLPAICPPHRTVLLTDSNVLKLHGHKLTDYPLIDAGSGEQAKTLQNAARIYGELMKTEADRSWTLIGIGGGIVTDLAGFIAGTYMRGIRSGFVATTLLGQVDAAIGGKNGLNFEGFKNMIGLIRQPAFVLCDLHALRTLPERELRGGLAEVIKYAAIRRPDLISYLGSNMERALEPNEGVLEHLVFESVLTKKTVVEADELETGERKILNFGHTFGHAFEKLYGMPHGEAVAAGMVLASRFSEKTGILPKGDAGIIEELVKRAGLPVKVPYEAGKMAQTMRMDKKRKGDQIDLVLLSAPGNALIKAFPVDELKSILDDLR